MCNRGWKFLIDETIIANDWDQLIDWEETKLIVSEPININNWTIIGSWFYYCYYFVIEKRFLSTKELNNVLRWPSKTEGHLGT